MPGKCNNGLDKQGKTSCKSARQPSALVDSGPAFLDNPAKQLLLITLLALIAYANTFHVPFVFDDESSIVNNPVVKDLPAFLSGAGYAYNPRRFIGYLSFALNYTLGGLDVTGYHLVNLAIHIINAWLVYSLVRLTFKTPYFAVSSFGFRVSGSETLNSKPETRNLVPLLAALLFVAHPVQTQAVTYIVQRLASLATLFYLASLVFYIKARLFSETSGSGIRDQGSGKDAKDRSVPGPRSLVPVAWFILSLVSAILAMRTKEIAATLPVVVLLYEFSFFGAAARKRLIVLPLLLTILIVPLGMLQAGKPLGEILSDVTELTRQSQVISRGDYLLTQFSVIVTYIRLLILPVSQNLDYDYPVYHSLFTPRVFLSFLLLCAILAGAVWLYYRSGCEERGSRNEEREHLEPQTLNRDPRTSRLISFGILWFFITLSVESSVIPISDVIFEHRLYLPSVGAFIALAAGASLLFKRFSPHALGIATAAVVIVLVTATWQRNTVWHDDLTLWSDAAAKSPGKYRPHNNMGNALNARERFDEAFEQYQLALKASPTSAEAHNNLGSAYERKGLPDKAVEQYQEALRLKPDYADAYLNLGSACQKQGRLREAFALYRKVLTMNPRHAAAHNNLGALYSKEGMPDKAAEEFLAAIRSNPDFVDAYVNLGEAYLMQGQPDRAVERLRAALARRPGNARAYYNLGVAADMRENFDEAIEMYETALKLDPAFPEAASNLGIDYASKGMTDRAIAQFLAAVRQKPDDADYRYNLVKVFELKGWREKADEERRLAGELERKNQ